MSSDWRRLRTLLEAPSPAVLATYRKDGSALVSPVWFRWNAEAFEVVIAEGDVKLRHLARDPRCLLVVFETVRPFRGIEARGVGRELFDLPRAPLPAADTPAPVRFLPKFDNVLLDRARVLPEEYRTVVIRKNADVQPTFTVDGRVAGVWRVERGKVVTEPFAPLPRHARRELDDEARRLRAWLS